ncbi:9f9a10e5-f639-4ebe-8b11-f4ac20f9bb28 [Sclerotinia trifoliorum]|uniref:9f9a10e5-f639-4ebe-8b11-f4ac20f9bb28 n=1 Tax=Sclerotinia trifoliorum TaxID=28548 RepID=A0A8H2W116_9HELO|nr:9f9a10e5-f639-4ebe-8b11-f4ac20f9bb28 [Sclerotinia trifoliorum]
MVQWSWNHTVIWIEGRLKLTSLARAQLETQGTIDMECRQTKVMVFVWCMSEQRNSQSSARVKRGNNSSRLMIRPWPWIENFHDSCRLGVDG